MRVFFGKSLIRLGQFIQSLAVVVMKPDQLVALNGQAYFHQAAVESWSRTVDYGLFSDEQVLLDKLTHKKGRLLLLGVGGGREAVVFARAGFEVTGVDFISALAEEAKNNLLKRGFQIEIVVQDVCCLEMPRHSFDVVWVSRGQVYSGIPTRKRRVEFLKKVRASLRADGCVAYLFSFPGTQLLPIQRMAVFFRKVAAFAALGNTGYQAGDTLTGGRMFNHSFLSEREIRLEFEEGGFELIHLSAQAPWGSLLARIRAEGKG